MSTILLYPKCDLCQTTMSLWQACENCPQCWRCPACRRQLPLNELELQQAAIDEKARAVAAGEQPPEAP